jgi:hypothetical protein
MSVVEKKKKKKGGGGCVLRRNFKNLEGEKLLRKLQK